jgi:hypothetical protein
MIDTVWKYLTENAIARWIAGAIVFLVGWEAVKRHLKEAGRKAEREASAVKQAQAREAVATRSAEIITEERTNADQALAARDNGDSHPNSDVVPDPVADILFRNDKAG